VVAVCTAGIAGAHDLNKPFPAFDPSDKVERLVEAFLEKAAAAKEAGVPDEAVDAARFAYVDLLTWDKHDISVCFWNGTRELQDWVMDKASAWSAAADLHFNYQTRGKNNKCKDASSADIRVNLDPNASIKLFANQEGNKEGNWSYVGRTSLNSSYLVTLNIPDVDGARKRNPTWALHAVRHEFGHALGLMHEHQREACAGWFDIPHIAEKYGWTVEYTQRYVGSFSDAIAAGLKYVGTYDRQSIMQYNFSKDMFLRKAGQTNPCYRENPISDLSDGDIEGIGTLYGLPDGAESTGRSAAEGVIMADIPAEQARAMRASLDKYAADLPTEVSPTARSNSVTVSPRAAFDEVLAALKEIEAVLPPR
jgi:hypothetical protein